MRLDLLALLAPPLTAGFGALTLASTSVVDGATVAFDGAEIAVIAALLAATTGALSLVFRLLLAAKDAQVANSEKRIAGLELLLSQTATRTADQERQLIDLLTGAVKASEVASMRAGDALADVVTVVREQAERTTAEHQSMVRALESLTRLHESMRGDRG